MTALERLRCPHCDHSALLGVSEKWAILQRHGRLRRDKAPDPQIVQALFADLLPSIPCENCHRPGLRTESWQDEEDPELWGQGRSCEGCGVLIPPERLEIFPDTRRCPECQRRAESGADQPVDYCPRCGTPRQVRTAPGPAARYEVRCPACGYRD